MRRMSLQWRLTLSLIHIYTAILGRFIDAAQAAGYEVVAFQ